MGNGARVLVLSLVLFGCNAGVAGAESFPGICKIKSGVIGGNRFATMDCRPLNKPSQNWDSSTIWENKDSKGYNNLARVSGRTFKCTFSSGGGIGMSGDSRTTTYKISDCK